MIRVPGHNICSTVLLENGAWSFGRSSKSFASWLGSFYLRVQMESLWQSDQWNVLQVQKSFHPFFDVFSRERLSIACFPCKDPWEKKHLCWQENSQAPFMVYYPTKVEFFYSSFWWQNQQWARSVQFRMALFSSATT